MKKSIIIILVFTILSLSVFAQNNYKTAVGLRLNGGAGITAKHFISEKSSLEGILYTRWHGLNITGLYQVNYPVFLEEPGFNFYMGAGAHMGVWDSEHSPWWDEDETGNEFVMGIDGQIGLEYTFGKIPLNLSLDWKPAINLVGVTNYWGDFALSVRYTFK